MRPLPLMLLLPAALVLSAPGAAGAQTTTAQTTAAQTAGAQTAGAQTTATAPNPAASPAPAAGSEAIATASGAPAMSWPEPADESEGPMRLSDHVDGGPGFLRPAGPCGGPATRPDGKPDRSPHGEVWAGIGTGGYREIGGAACVPLGEGAAVNIAIDAGQYPGWRGRGR